jgi:hypothetical protein
MKIVLPPPANMGFRLPQCKKLPSRSIGVYKKSSLPLCQKHLAGGFQLSLRNLLKIKLFQSFKTIENIELVQKALTKGNRSDIINKLSGRDGDRILKIKQ